MDSKLDSNQSRSLFLKVLILHARNGVIDDMKNLLEQGPSKSADLEELVAFHQWFEKMDAESKDYTYRVITEAIDRAIFSTLTIIDGAAGGYPASGELSDFALYLQIYKDQSNHVADVAETSVRLNPVSGFEDLHDLFLAEVQKLQGNQ